MSFMGSSVRQIHQELSTNDEERMIAVMKAWATKPTRKNSKTITGIANAHLIEKIAKNGRVTKDDEYLILNSIDCQKSWWQVLILMDTLILALLIPLVVYEELSENDHFDTSTRYWIELAYHVFLSFTFFLALTQLFVVLLVFSMTPYLVGTKSILFFFIQCHHLFIGLNTFGMLIVPGIVITALLGHLLMVGPYHSIPMAIFGSLSLSVMGYLYVKVIKPIFVSIFESDFGNFGEPDSVQFTQSSPATE